MSAADRRAPTARVSTADAPDPRAGSRGPLPPLRRGRDYVCVVLAAAGLWASFPGPDLWWLLVPSCAILVATVDRVGAGRAAWYAGLIGLGFWLPHIEWVRVATGGWLPWVALALTQVVPFALWGWTVSVARVWLWTRSTWGQALVAGVTWAGFEQLRARVPFGGFPWGTFAYAQVDAPLGHLAPLGGETLVSALVMVAAVLLRRATSLSVAHDTDRWWARPAALVAALALLVAPVAVPLPAGQQEGALTVGVIQGNVEIPGARTYAVPGKVTGNNARVTDQLTDSGERVDLLIWGEDSIDVDPARSSLTRGLVTDAIDRAGTPAMVGWQEFQDDSRTNWVGMWYPESGPSGQRYGKQHPVPFGEFIPWRDVVSHLATETAQVNVDMLPVDNIALMEADLADGRTVPLTVGICFEVAYEPLLSEGVRAGGQMIVTPTNNFHFRNSAESAQQLQMLRFRAMEFSRSAVQASTNGVSGIVRPDGALLASTDTQVAAFITGEVPLRTSLTPAARLADLPAWTVIVLTLVLSVASAGGTLALTRRQP